MILTFLLNFAAGFVLGWYSLTSGAATLPAGISSAITYAVNAIGLLNYIIPTGQLIAVMVVVMVVEGALWGFKGAVWIYRHIPFIGH